jgi:hypothetical protein
MSNQFNKIINDRQFNFQTIEFGDLAGYHVDVKDEEGTRWEFRMFPDAETHWKIEAEKIPSWITQIEPELRKAINERE